MPNISNTDLKKAVAYLSGAASTYDSMPGQRNVCRAWVIRQLLNKLEKKIGQ